MDRERARVGVDGLSGGRDAAADGGGGQRGRQRRRVHRAARGARRLPQRRALSGDAESRAPHDQRRHRGDADHDHGRRRHRRHREARADRRLHRRGQDRHRAEADQRPLLAFGPQRVVRRVRAVDAIPRSPSSSSSTRPKGRTAITAAWWPRRSSRTSPKPALRYLGVPSTDQSAVAVLVARHDASAERAPATSVGAATEPVVSLVADGPPGTVPDLRGMSARDAVRKLVKLGLNARMSGDGFVVSQVAGGRCAARRRRAVPPRARALASSRRVVTASRP